MIPPGNTDILPPAPAGTRFRLEAYPSTVQLWHEISDCRRVLVEEVPIPHDPQPRQYWRLIFAPALAEYLRRYGA